MFFDKSDISASILDVLELNQKNINIFNTGRNFNAISFRISADAELSYKAQSLKAGDNSVIFAPANLDYARKAKYDRLIAVHFNIQNYIFEDMEILEIKNPEKLSGLFSSISEHWQGRATGYIYTCNALLNEIFAECYREHYSPKESKSKISASVSFINENFTNPDITLRKIAEVSYMSEVYFRKLFKAEYGTTPAKYISKLKINKAINLMATGYYSLKEIAILSGYSDYAYFSENFKKHKGCAPSEYFYNYKE